MNTDELIKKMAKAFADSDIRDDEGPFPRLFDMLDFSGENKAWTVVTSLAKEAVKIFDEEKSEDGRIYATAILIEHCKDGVCSTYLVQYHGSYNDESHALREAMNKVSLEYENCKIVKWNIHGID